MKVVFHLDRRALIVGTCSLTDPDCPADSVELMPRRLHRFHFDAKPLPPGLEYAAEPRILFRYAKIGFPGRRWTEWERVMLGFEEDGPEGTIAHGWPHRFELAVEVTPTGPHPRHLPGWRPHAAWWDLPLLDQWRRPRQLAGIE